MISLLIILELLFALGFLVLPIVWLVLLLARAKRKHIGKAIIICLICFIVNGIAIGELGGTSEETNEVAVEEKVQAPVVPEAPPIEVEESIKETAPEPVAEPGSGRSNPIIVTVSQFVSEINSNADTAKAKYNGKWVRITGKVLSAHNVAGMTSFYLHGEKGGSGLKIVCWVNEEVLKPFDYRGETHSFIGQVREITTTNATEIGDCEIIG